MGLPVYDVLGIVTAQMFWTMVETTVAITAVCLPAIKKIMSWSAFGKSLSDLGRYMKSKAGSSGWSGSRSNGAPVSQPLSSDAVELSARGTLSRASSRFPLRQESTVPSKDEVVQLVVCERCGDKQGDSHQ